MEDHSNPKNGLYFLTIKQLVNDTYIAKIVSDREQNSTTLTKASTYDDTGALYYVVAVVLMYGFSIILMIGSSVKKSKQDHGVHKYMKNLDKIKRLERRQEKFKARLLMYGKRSRKVLGSDRAEVVLEMENPSVENPSAENALAENVSVDAQTLDTVVLTPDEDREITDQVKTEICDEINNDKTQSEKEEGCNGEDGAVEPTVTSSIPPKLTRQGSTSQSAPPRLTRENSKQILHCSNLDVVAEEAVMIV